MAEAEMNTKNLREMEEDRDKLALAVLLLQKYECTREANIMREVVDQIDLRIKKAQQRRRVQQIVERNQSVQR